MIREGLRSLREILSDPVGRTVLSSVASMFVIGTLFFRWVEGWSLIDSLYFTVVTLATVGYGDFSPATTAGKVGAIFLILFGVSALLAFLNLLMTRTVRRRGWERPDQE